MIAYKKVGVCFFFSAVEIRFLVLIRQFVSLLNSVLNQYFAVSSSPYSKDERLTRSSKSWLNLTKSKAR